MDVLTLFNFAMSAYVSDTASKNTLISNHKDMLSFWKGVKKENNSRLPLSTKVNNCVGEENICKMWQTHYQTLLNGVKTTEHKERILIETLAGVTIYDSLFVRTVAFPSK